MSACIACGGTTAPWIASPLDPKTGNATPYGATVRCRDCGTARAEPMPRPEETPGFYELDTYYTQNGSHMPDVPVTLADRILGKLGYWGDRGSKPDVAAVAAGLPPGGAVLDIGSGGGQLLEALVDLGLDAFGVEPDPNARSHRLPGATVWKGSAEAIPDEAARRRYDLIIMSHVLEHCVDPVAALASVRRLLAPDGTFWVEVPNASCRHFETFGPVSENFDAPRHLHHFTASGLTALLDQAGLPPRRTYWHGFQRHHAPSWRAWERQVFDAARTAGGLVGGARHDYRRSARMLAETALAPPARKYDSVGMLCSTSERG